MKRYPDPAAAGRELAVRLKQFNNSSDTIVLAIVSGGLFVASEVARELQLPLELLFIRRLAAPFGPQNVLCAMNVAGTLVIDDDVPPQPSNPMSGLDYSVADGLRLLSERERSCRGGRRLRLT